MMKGVVCGSAPSAMYVSETPRSDIAVMIRPETAPPLNEMSSAFPSLVWAAAAVRMFVLTATDIPMTPASALQVAPTMNASCRKGGKTLLSGEEIHPKDHNGRARLPGWR